MSTDAKHHLGDLLDPTRYTLLGTDIHTVAQPVPRVEPAKPRPIQVLLDSDPLTDR